ncbi:MAG TPA: carboxypeptidase-like regulatory domain-containing protein [Acidisarcina sp.]
MTVVKTTTITTTITHRGDGGGQGAGDGLARQRTHPSARRSVSRSGLRLALLSLAISSLAGTADLAFTAPAQAESAPQKVVQGKVFDEGDVAQPGAIVYLKSAKSDAIKSFIATADGGYRFGQLATDTDYTLWAELNGKKSATKTITAFDSKKEFLINLHLK